MEQAYVELERLNAHQRRAWETRSADFPEVLAAVHPHIEHRFLQPDWERYQRRLESFLTPRPPFNFLASTTLRDTMVMVIGGRRFKREMATCRAAWGADRLRVLAEEDLAGDPVLHSLDPLTSHTRIHHLHTLTRYRRTCGHSLDEPAVSLEWGSGFGGLARLLRRLADEQTQVLVDLPIMCALQWLYLGVTLGADAVHLVDGPGAGIEAGRINIVPNGLLDEVTVRPDMFISTWALGESEPAAQDACVERGWLDAPRLLIADQRTMSGLRNSDRLLDLASGPDTRVEPIETVPRSFYVFR